MNKWKAFAILFSLMSLGGIKETHRIFTSSSPDIVQDRLGLGIMALVITLVTILLAIRFWNKASQHRL